MTKDIRQIQREIHMWEPLYEAVYKDGLLGWKLMNQPTAAGKTYGMYNEWIPKVISEEGNMVFCWLVTENSQKEVSTWQKILHMALRNTDHYGIVRENMPMKEVMKHYRDGDTVVNVVTDPMMTRYSMSDFGWLSSLWRRFGVIRDEFHGATSSSTRTTEANTGTKMSGYKAQFFNLFKEYIDTTPHLYGMSATFTNEMLGVVGTEHYHQIGDNLSITPQSIRKHLKPLGSFDFFDAQIGVHGFDEEVKDQAYIQQFEKFASSLIRDREYIDRKSLEYDNIPEFNSKVFGLINVENTMTDVPSHWLGLDKETVIDYYIRSGLSGTDHTYGVITGDSKEEYDFDGNRIASINGNDWVYRAEDSGDPLLFGVTLNIGCTGTNIKNLTKALLLRNYSSEWNGQRIINRVLQVYGRMTRVNQGDLTDEQWDQLPSEFKIELYRIINTFDMTLREQPHSREAIARFRELYCVEYDPNLI